MSGGTITRIALEVPMVIAQFSSVAQPEPTLAAAPSPMAGNQGISCSAGQRAANSGFSPCYAIVQITQLQAIVHHALQVPLADANPMNVYV